MTDFPSAKQIAFLSYMLCTCSVQCVLISPSLSCVFPEPSLTPHNLSTVLHSMEDRQWYMFGGYANIPDSELMKIQSQYASDRECKQAVSHFLISDHPAPSWDLVAHALYQVRSDGSHRALEHLQQLFPICTWFHYPGLLLHTELMVSLFVRCTMRCEIWAQPAELPR